VVMNSLSSAIIVGVLLDRYPRAVWYQDQLALTVRARSNRMIQRELVFDYRTYSVTDQE